MGKANSVSWMVDGKMPLPARPHCYCSSFALFSLARRNASAFSLSFSPNGLRYGNTPRRRAGESVKFQPQPLCKTGGKCARQSCYGCEAHYAKRMAGRLRGVVERQLHAQAYHTRGWMAACVESPQKLTMCKQGRSVVPAVASSFPCATRP